MTTRRLIIIQIGGSSTQKTRKIQKLQKIQKNRNTFIAVRVKKIIQARRDHITSHIIKSLIMEDTQIIILEEDLDPDQGQDPDPDLDPVPEIIIEVENIIQIRRLITLKTDSMSMRIIYTIIITLFTEEIEIVIEIPEEKSFTYALDQDLSAFPELSTVIIPNIIIITRNMNHVRESYPTHQ
jgi:hypothetical protein